MADNLVYQLVALFVYIVGFGPFMLRIASMARNDLDYGWMSCLGMALFYLVVGGMVSVIQVVQCHEVLGLTCT